MSADENPYAPPQDTATAIPDAPRPFGWELAGSAVWVRHASQFPMVDPFTGTNSETMMLHQIEVRYRPRWLLTFPALGAALGFAADVMNLSAQGPLALLGAVLGWLLAGVVGMFLPVCMLRLFFEKRTIRIQTIANRIMTGLLLLFLPGGILCAAGPPWLQVVPLVALACWLIGCLVRVTLWRRLRCIRRDDARFEIRGFHPLALESLAGRTKTGGPETAR